MPITPAFKRGRQADEKFKVIFSLYGRLETVRHDLWDQTAGSDS